MTDDNITNEVKESICRIEFKQSSDNGTFNLCIFGISTKELVDCIVEEIKKTISFFGD